MVAAAEHATTGRWRGEPPGEYLAVVVRHSPGGWANALSTVVRATAHAGGDDGGDGGDARWVWWWQVGGGGPGSFAECP